MDMENIIDKIKLELNLLANKQRVNITKKFFKTNKGDYAFKDKFIGIKVPDLRQLAKKYLPKTYFGVIKYFLYSDIHEYRMFSLISLTYKYESEKDKQKLIYDFYIKHINQVNSWDLVDVSCHKILGNYLLNQRDNYILYKFAQSNNFWVRRVSIVSTLEVIRHNYFQTTLEISLMLLNDNHDLIHKAVGWLIREVGKKNTVVAKDFLLKYSYIMHKTSFKYATEKIYMKKRIFDKLLM